MKTTNLLITSVIGLSLLAVSACRSIRTTHPGGSLVVACTGSDKLTIIDCDTGTVTATPDAGGIGSQSMALDPDTNIAYVLHSYDNRLSVIDLNANKVLANITTAPLPAEVIYSKELRHLFISCGGASAVYSVNIDDFSIDHEYSVSRGPLGIDLAPDGAHLYVSSFLSNSISLIDLKSPAHTAHIQLHSCPKQDY
jgi:YVTN family beta-propeller protein